MTHKPDRHRSAALLSHWWVLVLALLTACMPGGGDPSAGRATSGAGSPFVPVAHVSYDVTCPAFDPAKSPLPGDLPAADTVAAGTAAGAFAVSHTGEATYPWSSLPAARAWSRGSPSPTAARRARAS
jgi:hypothetical protein